MKNKDKRYKKIITTLLTVLFAVSLYIPNITQVNALSNVTSSNSYGGYTWQVIDTSFDMDGNVTLSSAQISMNLNGHYTGSFTINIALSTIIDSTGIGYTNTINNYGFICNGCRITTYDSSHLYVAITDCNYWEIQIIPIKNASIKNWRSILNALDISSITGWSMTKLDEITATQITTISNTLTSINSNIATTNSRLTTTNTELHNIYNSIGNAAQYGTIQTQLHMIQVNSESMINELQDIDTHVTSYLTGTIDNQTVNIWDLQNDANYSLSNIETTLNTINNNINDYTSQLNSIQTLLTSIDSNLSNIDNTIDLITWETLTPTYEISNNMTSWSTSNYVSVSSESYGYLRVTDLYYARSHIYKLTLQYGKVTQGQVGNLEIEFGYVNNGEFIKSEGKVLYYPDEYYRYSKPLTIYFTDVNDRDTSTQRTVIRFKNNGSGNARLYIPTSLQRIQPTDIEYWQLLQYFNQYDMNKKLLEAINSINISITNTTIQDTQTNITDYNTIYNQVSNVEQTYINEYNTNNTTLQSIIDDKKGLPDNIVNVSTDIESKMSRLFTVPEFKYLFALIISGCVLIALLG